MCCTELCRCRRWGGSKGASSLLHVPSLFWILLKLVGERCSSDIGQVPGCLPCTLLHGWTDCITLVPLALCWFLGGKGTEHLQRDDQQTAQKWFPRWVQLTAERNLFSMASSHKKSFSFVVRIPVWVQTVNNKVAVACIHRSWVLWYEEHFIPVMLIFSICSLLPAR